MRQPCLTVRSPYRACAGGGRKYEKAMLDYSLMLPGDLPHVRCVFVRPSQLLEYRSRYPELLLVTLPADPAWESAVGDARFWIKTFVTQLQLDADKRFDFIAAVRPELHC